jgi:hypothetical protein
MYKLVLFFIAVLSTSASAQWIHTGGCEATLNPGDDGLSVAGSNIISRMNDGGCRSTDNGETWTGSDIAAEAISSDGLLQYQLQYIGKDTIAVLRSLDAGVTWKKVRDTLTIGTVSGLCVIGSEVFTGHYVSTDNGVTWSVAQPTIERAVAMEFSNPVVASSLWTQVVGTPPPSEYPIFYAYSEAKLFAQTNNTYPEPNYVYLSIDSGQTWFREAPLPTPFGFLLAYGPYLFGGYNAAVGEVDVSTDDGQSWINISTERSGSAEIFHRAMQAVVSGPNIIVGTTNTGRWYRHLSNIAAELSAPTEDLQPIALLANARTIHIDSPQPMLSIGINTIVGITALTIRPLHLTSYDIGISTFLPGIYFLRIQTSKGISIHKIVKE